MKQNLIVGICIKRDIGCVLFVVVMPLRYAYIEQNIPKTSSKASAHCFSLVWQDLN